jgi:hypothetical protein
MSSESLEIIISIIIIEKNVIRKHVSLCFKNSQIIEQSFLFLLVLVVLYF